MARPVVIDNGSYMIKAGFAGQESPTVLFPTVVGKVRVKGMMEELAQKDTFIGNDALVKRGVLHLTNPIEFGIVTNWDSMEKIWHHTFYEELRVNPEEHPVLLTEAPVNPKSNRERMTKMMFETFQVSSLCLAKQPLLAFQASGLKTGIVVDSGYGSTWSIPIHEGKILKEAVKRTELGGKNLTEYLLKLLNEMDHDLTTESEKDIVNNVKESACYVVLDFEYEMERPDSSHQKDYEMPDGSSLTAGKEFFKCPEALFQKAILGGETIHQAVQNSVEKCEEDLQKEMYANILLAGGNTLFTGLDDRLEKELKALAPPSTTVKINAPVEREFSAWCGGSNLASGSVSEDIWITKKEYDETGPSIVHRKCP